MRGSHVCTSISSQMLIMQQSTRDGIETTPLSTTGRLTCTDDIFSVHAVAGCGDTWNCKDDDSSACAAAAVLQRQWVFFKCCSWLRCDQNSTCSSCSGMQIRSNRNIMVLQAPYLAIEHCVRIPCGLRDSTALQQATAHAMDRSSVPRCKLEDASSATICIKFLSGTQTCRMIP